MSYYFDYYNCKTFYQIGSVYSLAMTMKSQPIWLWLPLTLQQQSEIYWTGPAQLNQIQIVKGPEILLNLPYGRVLEVRMEALLEKDFLLNTCTRILQVCLRGQYHKVGSWTFFMDIVLSNYCFETICLV